MPNTLPKHIFRLATRRRFSLLCQWIVGESLLDIGAAEGWIGEAAAEAGYQVQLIDVVDLNQTQLPHRIYNGRHLPFQDNAFDTVMILLTLHHCDEPETVLAEAARIARKRIIVTESVYRTKVGQRLLNWMDGNFNHARSSGHMPPALHFKSADEWAALFRAHGLEIVHRRESLRGLHRQHCFALDLK